MANGVQCCHSAILQECGVVFASPWLINTYFTIRLAYSSVNPFAFTTTFYLNKCGNYADIN